MPQAYILLLSIHPEHFSFIFKNTHTSNQTAACSFLLEAPLRVSFWNGKLQKENFDACHDVWHGLGTGNEILQWKGETFLLSCVGPRARSNPGFLCFFDSAECTCSLWRAVSGVQLFALELSYVLWFQWWSIWKSQLRFSLEKMGACRSTERVGKAALQQGEGWWLILGFACWWSHLHLWSITLQPSPNKHLLPTCLTLQAPEGDLGWSPQSAGMFPSHFLLCPTTNDLRQAWAARHSSGMNSNTTLHYMEQTCPCMWLVEGWLFSLPLPASYSPLKYLIRCEKCDYLHL